MFSSVVLSVFCLAAVAIGQDDSAQFYGYGTGIRGLPLFYADGTAYLGNVSLSDASLAINVTLVTPDADDNSITAAPVDATSTGNLTSTKLYIDNNSGAFASAGFSDASNTSLTTTGFGFFGTMLVWISEAGDMTSKWYAEKIETGLWELKWNVDNVVSDTAVPVVLKNRAPSAKRST